jgi:hypothetical protein
MTAGLVNSTANDTVAAPCRMVTTDEIAHYQELGWVKLKSFIDSSVIAEILALARARMGYDGDGTDPSGQPIEYFNAALASGLQNSVMRSVMEGASRSAKLLMNDMYPDTRVRYFTDVFVPKLPAGKKSRNGGNGATAFHQDFCTFALDRSGGMTFWVPLEAYGPDSGTMSFVDGSHKLGVLGNYVNYCGGDALDAFPVLRDMNMSGPQFYDVGDVTVHSHLMIHGAGKNLLDHPRWAYLITVNPADAVWTGAPPEAFDTTGMQAYHGFPDARFPILA